MDGENGGAIIVDWQLEDAAQTTGSQDQWEKSEEKDAYSVEEEEMYEEEEEEEDVLDEEDYEEEEEEEQSFHVDTQEPPHKKQKVLVRLHNSVGDPVGFGRIWILPLRTYRVRSGSDPDAVQNRFRIHL
jgi:hypothetical protein